MKTENKPFLVIRLRKRHLAVAVVLGAILVFGLSIYLRFFTVLPQTAINILPPAPMDLKGKTVLIYSPHCDDETLGAFGVIKRTLSEGGRVHLVVVTDCNKHGIGKTRKAETISAMQNAGLNSSEIEFLNFAEGREKKDPAENKQFRDLAVGEIDKFQPDYIFLPHPDDTHMDHKFVGRNVEQVIGVKGIQNKAIYYLIHYNFMKYPSPPGFKPDAYLLPPARLISFTDLWYRFDLSSSEQDAKEEAVFTYKSQLKKSNPVLTRVLFDFIRQNELFMIKRNAG